MLKAEGKQENSSAAENMALKVECEQENSSAAERIARNRFLAQCRRKEKRRQLETTKKKIKDLHLQNEELKRLNRQLLQELLDHGADFLQADAPPSCVAR